MVFSTWHTFSKYHISTYFWIFATLYCYLAVLSCGTHFIVNWHIKVFYGCC